MTVATGTLTAPLLALAVAVVLGVVVGRWVFGPPRRSRRQRSTLPDYGLLVPVRRTDDRADAERVRALLARHGLRATLAPAGRGYDASGRPWPAEATYVLVFPADEARARGLVSAEPR